MRFLAGGFGRFQEQPHVRVTSQATEDRLRFTCLAPNSPPDCCRRLSLPRLRVPAAAVSQCISVACPAGGLSWYRAYLRHHPAAYRLLLESAGTWALPDFDPQRNCIAMQPALVGYRNRVRCAGMRQLLCRPSAKVLLARRLHALSSHPLPVVVTVLVCAAPTQVSTGCGSGATCSCSVYRLAATCLHVKATAELARFPRPLQPSVAQPPPAAAGGQGPTVGSSATASAQPPRIIHIPSGGRPGTGGLRNPKAVEQGDHLYLEGGTLLRCVRGSGRLRCCHSGHGHACEHVRVVKEHCGAILPRVEEDSSSSSDDQAAAGAAGLSGLGPGAAGGDGGMDLGWEAQQLQRDEQLDEPGAEEDEEEGEAGEEPGVPRPIYAYPCDSATAACIHAWESGNATRPGALQLQPQLPEGGAGPCGCPYTPHVVATDALVFGGQLVGPRKAVLYELRSGCGRGCSIRYSGIPDGLFRHSSRTWFSLHHLYTFTDLLCRSGLSPEAYAGSQSRLAATVLHRQVPGGIDSFSPNTFRAAWYSFVDCLDMQHTFQCSVCRGCPRIIVGDATAVTLQRSHYHGESVTEMAPGAAGGRTAGTARSGTELCWCSTKAGREAISLVSTCFNGGKRDVYGRAVPAAFEPLDPDRPGGGLASSLRDKLPAGCGTLTVDFVSALERVFVELSLKGGSVFKSGREALARFVGCLASLAPVRAYLPTELARGFVRAWAAGPGAVGVWMAAAEEAQLGARAPLLYRVLLLARGVPSVWGSAEERRKVMAVVSRLCDLSGLCGTGFDGGKVYEVPVAASSLSDCLRTGVVCGLERRRDREATVMNGRGDGRGGDEGDGCTHAFVAKGPRTGGIFTLFCEHGICYSFFILPKAEGRNELYSWMVSYLERAPEVVVYDFACSAHKYCTLRAPGFFKDTTWVVDRFHWKNHKSCSHAYDMSQYPWLDHVNSEIAEQVNSQLQAVKAAVSQMKQENYVKVLRLVLTERNLRVEEKIAVARRHVERIMA